MRLLPGSIAPPIEWKDINGEAVSLNKFRGKPVLLSFYRYASCPLCNLRIHQLLQHYPSWQEQQMAVLAVFESPAKHIHRYLGKHTVPFPILPDPAQVIYRRYGLKASWKGFWKAWFRHFPMIFEAVADKHFLPGRMDGDWAMIPADFLITPSGVIAEAFYGSHIGDHLPIERITRFLDTFNQILNTEEHIMQTEKMYIDITPPAEEKAKVDGIIEPFTQMLGKAPTGLGMLGISPPLLEKYAGTIQYYLGHDKLKPRLLTYIRYLVSWSGQCHYCVDLNEAFLIQEGLELKDIRASRDNPQQLPLEDSEKNLLLLALDAVSNPHAVNAERIENLRGQGWTDRDIFDAVWHATSNRAFGQTAEALGLISDGYVA